jgi:hypothetical protein
VIKLGERGLHACDLGLRLVAVDYDMRRRVDAELRELKVKHVGAFLERLKLGL